MSEYHKRKRSRRAEAKPGDVILAAVCEDVVSFTIFIQYII